MENNIPSLLSIDTDFIVENVGKISKNFSAPLDLPSNLIELIFKKYVLHNRYIAEQEIQYFLSQKAHFSSIDFSSSFHFSNSWIDLLPSTIINLDVSNCSRLTDEGLLKIVATLPNLEQLKINDSIHISQKCWTCVASLTKLQVFEAASTQFGDEALTLLTESCRDLRVLNLNYTRVFKAISDIKNLTQLLDLDLHSTKITAGGVADICKTLTQLKRFRADLFDDGAFNNVFPHLPQSLEALELEGLPDFYSPNFEHLTALQRLEMNCWNLGNVVNISNFKNLTRIKVDAAVTVAEDYDWSKVKYLKAGTCDPLPHTTSLVNCPKIKFDIIHNHRQIENLTDLTNLASIDIEAGDDIITIIKTFTNLSKIRLTEENQQQLSEIVPRLAELNIKALISPFTFESVTTLTSLEKLGIWEQGSDLGNGVLTNLTWLEAQGHMDQIAQLTNLRLLDIRYAQDTKIELLTSLTNLTFLDIGGIPFSEESFEALTYHLTNLKWLMAMDVTDINCLIPHMTRLHKLQHLLFDQTPAPGMLSLLSQLPSLKALHCTIAQGVGNVVGELLPSPSLCVIMSENGDENVIQQFKEVGVRFV